MHRLRARGRDVRPEIYDEVISDTLEAVLRASRAGRIREGLWPYARRVAMNISSDYFRNDRVKRETEVNDIPGESIPALPDQVYIDELQKGVSEFFADRYRTRRAKRFGWSLAEVLDTLPEEADSWSVRRLRSHIKQEVARLMHCQPDSVNRLVYRVLQETGGRQAFELWYATPTSRYSW